MNHSDLIHRCRHKEPKAQKMLFDTFAKTVHITTCRYVRDHSYVADVMQESWIQIFNSLEHYKEEGKLEAWIKRIVINHAIKLNNKHWFNDVLLGEDLPQINDTDCNMLEALKYKEVVNLIERLPDGYREVFQLAILDDFSHKEIGEMLGIEASTSRSKLSIARRKFIEILHRENAFVYAKIENNGEN